MLSIHIKIYFWSFVYRHYQQMYFYNWNFTLSYCFFCKMKIRITLSKNTPGNIRCPYFASLTIFLEFICLLYARVTCLECHWLSFKVLNHFYCNKIVCWLVMKGFQTGKIDVIFVIWIWCYFPTCFSIWHSLWYFVVTHQNYTFF